MKAIFVGPEKTGTSWVDTYLRSHPEVALPEKVKETYFFDRHYDKGIAWYESMFGGDDANDHSSKQCRVEVAPSYFKEPDVPERIRSHYPQVQIIISLREPVARTESMYRHLVSNGWTTASIAQAIESEPWLMAGSKYATGVRRWREAFPAAQVHVLQFEHLKSNPIQYARQICEAIGIDPQGVGDELIGKRVNAARNARSPLLAMMARKAIYATRAVGGYTFIELLKKAGVGNLIWSKGKSDSSISAEDRQRIASELTNEMEQLFADEGIDFRIPASTCDGQSS